MKKCTNCGTQALQWKFKIFFAHPKPKQMCKIDNYLVEQRDEGIADGILVGEDSGSLASALGGEPLEAGEEGGKFDEGLIGLGLDGAFQSYEFG